jgi:hypothetical protein
MPGQAGILEDINKTYIHSINELPYSPGIPEKSIQKSGHILGWVDIVGFKQMIRDKGIDYVPGSPADYAIVQYDAWADLQNCGSCYVVYIKNQVTVRDSGSMTTAQNNIDLKWAEIITNCDSNGCWQNTISRTEYAIFSVSARSPLQFKFPTNQAITIEKYRGVVPKNIIKFRDMDEGIIAYRVTTGNGSVLHRRKIGKIETTQKGIFFMNLTPLSVWEKTGSGIYHWRDDPIMGDDEITGITFDTPYGKAPNVDYSSGMVYHENRITNIQAGVWSVLYVVLIFFIGIYIMYKSSGS